MGVLLIAILAAVPLVITPGSHLFFDLTPKAVLLLLGAAAAVPLALREWSSVRGFARTPYGRRLAALLAAAAVWLLAAAAFSVDRGLSFDGTDWRRFGVPERLAVFVLTLAAGAWIAGAPNRARRLARAAVACGIPVAVYGIAQYFGWDPWLPRAGYLAGEAEWTIVRPPSTLGHATYFATWLLFPVFWGAGLALRDPRRLWRLAGLAAALTGAAAILLSGTRAAALGLLAGAFVFRPSRRSLALAGAALALFTAFYFLPAGEMLRRRVHWIREDPIGGARPLLWRDTLSMALQRPLSGYGPETFSLTFPRYQSVELARAYPDFHHESPHNLFLDALAEGGVPALGILLALVALGLSAARHDPALLAGLVAAVVSLQFSPLTIPVALYLFLSWAMPAPPAAKRPPAPPGLPLRAVALAGAAALAFTGVRLWTADTFLGRTAHALGQNDVRAAADSFDRARAWGAHADLWYSRRLAAVSQNLNDPASRIFAWREAVQAAVRATATEEDRANAYYNLAAFAARQDDFAGTERNLRLAAAAAPNWFKPYWVLAQALQQAGRVEEARQLAEKAALLDAGVHPEVRRTLDELISRSSQRSPLSP